MGEMALWLKALVALAEVPGPRTRMVASNTGNSRSEGF